jgi:type I restriction enzyme S subunit
LGDICRTIYRYPSFYGMEKHSTGVPVIRGEHLLDSGRISTDWKHYWFVSKEYAAQFPKTKLEEHDIVMSVRGTVGQFAQVGSAHVGAQISPNTIRISPDPRKVDPQFLYHAFRAHAFGHFLQGTVATSAVPGLRAGDIKEAPLNLPPLAEQKAIAAVLGALDDKIELNRRMNATLEAMARALFQSWFVDFDPVRAKLDGRQPHGVDPATAGLFPNEFEDSELGHIPNGWHVKTVGDVGKVICGKTPRTSVGTYYGNDIPFITIPDMHGNVFAAATARKLSHAGANSQANKTLPAGSLCVSCIATPGLVIITSEPSQTNQQINSIVPHQTEETYFWYWALVDLGAEIAASGSGGSVLANLNKSRFETLRVVKPPHALICDYNRRVRPIFEAILANSLQSRTLSAVRDTLLPKLLSGQVIVLR